MNENELTITVRSDNSLTRKKLELCLVLRCNQAEYCDRRQRQRDQYIITGERKAEKAPGRLVAAHDMDRLQLIEQRPLAINR